MVANVNYKRDVTNVRIILVIGPSGAGKSTALNALEDAGFSADLPKCETDLHFIGFSLDIQCPPSLVRRSAQIAKRAAYHHINGLGHLSLIGHKPDIVNKKIAEIIGY